MSQKKREIPWSLIIGIVAVIALFGAWFALPLDEWLKTFSSWIEGLGVWGYVLFIGVYILACTILAPGTPLTIAAGLVFGLAWGFVVVMIGATVGAALAFLIARYVAREKISAMLKKKPKFAAINKAITEDGWKVVLLLRLSPLVPFNLQNYFFGVTEVKFWHFVWASFVGIIPGVLLYLYLGAAGGALSGGGGKWGAPQWIFFGLGLIATVIVTVIVSRKAKAKLKDVGGDEDKDDNKEKPARSASKTKTAHA